MIIDSRYEVLEILGTGVWATVYKVKDLRSGDVFALKLFHKLDSDSLYEKFSAEEMHHITQIDHLNLIKVISFGYEGKHIYYLSEYIEGKSLNHFKFSSDNLSMLYEIIAQICYGLNALHNHGIIHKDLKPENIFFKENPGSEHRYSYSLEVKILDFGFTKIDIQKSQQHISGTLPYVAPELFLRREPTYQTDFYSLGVTLYKLTTGILPYSLEQLTKMMSGEKQNIFPQFPREINPDVPGKLEKFILKLLEKNPEDRFANIESIISYINRIQPRKYIFSKKQSLLNNIRSSSYFVRDDYSHKLLDFIPIVKEKNGRTVILSGGQGSGKNNILTLFRYHILTDDYFVFDYTCNTHHRDPFFALIKEFLSYLTSREKRSRDKLDISDKLRKFLFDSEEAALDMSEDQKELDFDFKFASNFLFGLSQEKPLIFIIRAGHSLEEDTVKFLNYISAKLMSYPILIIISIDDKTSLTGLIYSSHIPIEPLNHEQARKYIENLLKSRTEESFVSNILERTNGNPYFIRECLFDLVQKKKIYYQTGDETRAVFKLNWEEFELPENIMHSIYRRLSRLSSKSYHNLQKLAVCQTPYNNDLIKHILEISDKELFFLINDCFNYEIFIKKGEYYYFTFIEAKKRLFAETDKQIQVKLSQKILSFFRQQTITQIPICEGIIKNAEFAGDYGSIRRFRLLLVDLLSKKNEQDKAFHEICMVIGLDFSGKIEITDRDLLGDLRLFQEKAELTGMIKTAINLLDTVENFPDIFEKFYIKGIFFTALEKYDDALEQLKKACKKSITGKQRVNALISLLWVCYRKGDTNEALKYLDILSKLNISDDLKISYIDRKALCLDMLGKKYEAIQLIEDFLPSVKIDNDIYFYVRLGSLYNNLGILYANKKSIEQAEKNFEIARKLWEQVNYKKALGTLYNNIGDINLKQGDTHTALHYFQKAMDICYEIEQKQGKVLVNLNFGETYNKIGKYKLAEEYLRNALQEIEQNQGKGFLEAINWNIALVKSKSKNFFNLYNFLKENSPDIFKNTFSKVTPLEKSFVYFLLSIGQNEQVKEIISKNTRIDFYKSNEEEFYYQILGVLAFRERDYHNSLSYFISALEFARKTRNYYSQTIIYLRIAQCYIAMKDTGKATEFLNKAEPLAETYNYFYWLCKIKMLRAETGLLDPEINFRFILRELISLVSDVKNNEYFLHEIRLYEMLFQICRNLKNERMTLHYYKLYKDKVEFAVSELPYAFKESYLKLKGMNLSYKDCNSISIAKKDLSYSDSWVELLYELLTFNEIERIKFFIDKIIFNLIAPNFYVIVLKNEDSKTDTVFLDYNYDEYEKILLNSVRFKDLIEKSIQKNRVSTRKINYAHISIVPLRVKSAVIGFMVVGDRGELPFTKEEIRLLSSLKLHLTSILIRIKSFSEIHEKMELMNKVMKHSQKLFAILDREKLEQEFVNFCLDFTNCSRCFLIKKDLYGNYIYQIAIDQKKEVLDKYTFISKTVLSEVQDLKQFIYTSNARADNILKNSISVQDYELNSIFCAPLYLDDELHALIYLDDHGKPDLGKDMEINTDFMEILLIQFTLALKNSRQYEDLMKKNLELRSLDHAKNEFINIVSHELNTPLTTLNNYVNTLNKEKKMDQKDYHNLIEKINENLNKLSNRINDIINMNKYRLLNVLNMKVTNVKALLEAVISELETLAKHRKMEFKTEIQENLPMVDLNWESFYLMIYNIILNAIRYTKDFGTIKIGARRSSFQQEEINNRESLVIYIEDNGMGIAQEDIANIFKPFYECGDLYSHHSGSFEYKSCGLGLGLSISNRIAELHEGKIIINSKQNEGTTVFVIIPFARAKKM